MFGRQLYIGTFDGNKHKIINLTIKETSDSPKGFFAYCNGTVKNLTVQGTYNVNSPAVGGIIGYSDEGCTVENCVSDVTITNSYSTDSTTYPSGTAGIVGFVSGDATVNISGCINLGNITAKTNIAGIVSGSTYDNNLEAIVNVNKCINVGAITSENMYIAGISCITISSTGIYLRVIRGETLNFDASWLTWLNQSARRPAMTERTSP